VLAVLGPVTVEGVPVVGRKTREVLALLAVRELAETGRWDALVVGGALTGIQAFR